MGKAREGQGTTAWHEVINTSANKEDIKQISCDTRSLELANGVTTGYRDWRFTSVIGLTLFALMAASKVVAAPDAGSTLQSVQPPPEVQRPSVSPVPAIPEEPAVIENGDYTSITVSKFIIKGATAIPTHVLEELVSDGKGKSLTLNQLYSYVRRITRYYRNEGYILARAYLPEQDIVDGQVEIAVLEGHYGEVVLNNTSQVDSSVLSPYLQTFTAGALIKSKPIEHQLLLMGDVAGVEVGSLLRPGADTGTSDLVVSAQGTKRFVGSAYLNNYGSDATGQGRLGATLSVANLAGLGDRTAIHLLSSGSGLSLGQLSWETPLNADGWRAGAAYTRLHYKLQEQFEPLDASGDAESFSLWTSNSLQRSRKFNLVARFGLDAKQLDDEIGVTDTKTEKRVNSATVTLKGDSQDRFGGGGANQFEVDATIGELTLDDQSLLLDQSDAGYDTNGRFGKMKFKLSRNQWVSRRISGYLALSGQMANKNLDSSEKFSLGGPDAVRAYPNGERSSDDAWLVTTELRWNPEAIDNLQLVLFADAAGGHLNHSPLPVDENNYTVLTGGGIGMRWRRTGDWSFEAFAAWQGDEEPTTESEKKPRAWAQLVKYF